MKFNELWDIGEKHYTNQNYVNALTFFEKAYLLNPSNSILNYIGCCYIGIESYDKAIEIFESLIYSTHWETPWYNLGRIYLKMEEYDKALKCFNEALEIRPDCDNCHFYLGVYYEKINNFKTAIKYYENAVGLCLDNYDKAMYYTNIGVCYSNIYDNKKALFYLNKAIEICEDYKEAHIKLKNLEGNI